MQESGGVGGACLWIWQECVQELVGGVYGGFQRFPRLYYFKIVKTIRPLPSASSSVTLEASSSTAHLD